MTIKSALHVQALTLVGLLSAGLHAQCVGIGTATPHASARLHISDNARGILIPNVALTATNVAAPVVGPATSLLVYNTATAGTAPHHVWPGFYYWDGSLWVRLLTNNNEAWLLEGNSGTNPTSNFLGTTDNQPLVIRINDQQTLQLNTNFSIQRDAGGNPRGMESIDLQRVRLSPTQVASGAFSVIGGGGANEASGNAATIGGGTSNVVSADFATVSGGSVNEAQGAISTIIGGSYNLAIGDYSVVLGGFQNIANGDYNLVFGETVQPTVTESHRVYLFGDGTVGNPSGRIAINRLSTSHPIHVGTDPSNGNGAHLTAAGVWTGPSSRTLKDRIRPLDPQEVLQKILVMPVEGWYYKGTEEYHIGPYAEDFYAAFGTGVLNSPDVGKYLAASDVAGVSLLGIQALHAENERLRQQLSQTQQLLLDVQQSLSYVRRENAHLQERLQSLELLIKGVTSAPAD